MIQLQADLGKVVIASLYIVMLGVSVVLGHAMCKRWKYGAAAVLVLSFILGLLAWAIWNRPYLLTYVLPATDAIYVANLFPMAVALAIPAAVKLATSRAQRLRVGVLMGLQLGVSFAGTYRLLSGAPAETGETIFFEDGTCRQSSIDTCSAAAAVTLLKEHGVSATESELARLALSKAGRGTHPLGLYRALKIITEQSTAPLDVHYRAISAGELLDSNKPAIVNVGLLHPPRNAFERDLVDKYQWEPGVVHSVVLLGLEGEKVKIADPDFGIELWDVEGFNALYQGAALLLNGENSHSR